MKLIDAIPLRHSVRTFLPRPVEQEKLNIIYDEIRKTNNDEVRFCLEVDNKKIFGTITAYFRKFRNVQACIMSYGDRFLSGYYGERLVLLIQTLGLNTCWVGQTYSKKEAAKTHGSKPNAVIAIGYGAGQGKSHKSKDYADVCDAENPPLWFEHGTESALLAPTALNRQDFGIFLYKGNIPVFTLGNSRYAEIDSGIVKCHFDLAAKECGHESNYFGIEKIRTASHGKTSHTIELYSSVSPFVPEKILEL